jgi:uncharacterized protein YecT (DUF1311 family)
MSIRYLCLIAFLLASDGNGARAMTFQTRPSPVDRAATVVVAEGAIEKGDAARFQMTISSLPPRAPIMVVTSPGGDVLAAIELARAIKERAYSVVVIGECASACAQIIFPAGEYSILTPGSLLGIHSCSSSGVRHDLCNEEIAKFAVSNGFPYGTIEHFSALYGPDDMKWMSEISARCFGFYRGLDDPKPIYGKKACVDGVIFTRSSPVVTRPFGPSFDCTKATTRIEKVFCLDRELMLSDSVLGRVYDVVLSVANTEKRARIRAAQRDWVRDRNAECEAVITEKLDFGSTRDGAMCLYRRIEERIYALLAEGTH